VGFSISRFKAAPANADTEAMGFLMLFSPQLYPEVWAWGLVPMALLFLLLRWESRSRNADPETEARLRALMPPMSRRMARPAALMAIGSLFLGFNGYFRGPESVLSFSSFGSRHFAHVDAFDRPLGVPPAVDGVPRVLGRRQGLFFRQLRHLGLEILVTTIRGRQTGIIVPAPAINQAIEDLQRGRLALRASQRPGYEGYLLSESAREFIAPARNPDRLGWEYFIQACGLAFGCYLGFFGISLPLAILVLMLVDGRRRRAYLDLIRQPGWESLGHPASLRPARAWERCFYPHLRQVEFRVGAETRSAWLYYRELPGTGRNGRVFLLGRWGRITLFVPEAHFERPQRRAMRFR
jgi:hypothetical protein